MTNWNMVTRTHRGLVGFVVGVTFDSGFVAQNAQSISLTNGSVVHAAKDESTHRCDERREPEDYKCDSDAKLDQRQWHGRRDRQRLVQELLLTNVDVGPLQES